MNKLIIVLLCFGFAWAQHDVIKISQKYTGSHYTGLALSNGGVYLDESNVYLIGKGAVFVQPKLYPDRIEKIDINLKYSKYFLFNSILHDQGRLIALYLGIDGRYYLCSINMGGSDVLGPVSKHGVRGRMIRTKRGQYLQAGRYRPLYAKYLDLYDDESGTGPTELAISKFKELYEISDAFLLSFYNDSLDLVDSAAVIPLKGEAAEAYEALYFSTPMDVDSSDNIYYVSHLDGYAMNRIDSHRNRNKVYPLWNENFRPIPRSMTKDEAEALNSESGMYSRVYALYADNKYILTSFVQNNATQKPTTGPYHIDIMTILGEQVFSIVSNHPVVTKSPTDKIYFAVTVKGGWLEGDQLYLVGMRIKDVLNGLAEEHLIKAAIHRFEKSQSK